MKSPNHRVLLERRSAIEHWTDAKDPQDFINHHVVFMYDEPEGYVDQIFQKVKKPAGAVSLL